MHPDIERFLNLRNLPARVTATQAAGYLGVSPHEIPMLMARGLLKPLGHPPPNGQKFFLTATLKELSRDEKWFAKACDAIVEHWRYKNSRKGQDTSESEDARQGADAPRLADAKN